jgi:hypothetical protein
VKRTFAVLGIAVAALAVLGLIALRWLSTAPLKVPDLPPSVPEQAVWVGHEWVYCSAANGPGLFHCSFYDDVDGRKLQEGRFRLSGSNESVPKVRGWDGTNLQLERGQLIPVDVEQ